MSGPLLDVLYDTNKEEIIKNLLLESKIFGVVAGNKICLAAHIFFLLAIHRTSQSE
jgi:hypothetical protein